MPHIKLEHTEIIETSLIRPVFKQLREILIENAGVKEENCKCKAIQVPIHAVGNNESGHFFHLEISLLKGRSEKIRYKIGQFCLETLKEYFTDNNGLNTKQLSVEIREMTSGNYFTTNTL
jgi:5-carboxymethyl-2-hydroxymuconate isomerase